jgi:hypothetical protein
MPKKIPLLKIGLLLLAASFVVLYLLLGFMWSFERCDKDHSALRRMRTMTESELAGLYERLMGLPKEYSDESVELRGNELPKDLRHLKAVYVQVSPNGAFIPLDKCNVSVGVGLQLYSAIRPPKRIELWWDDKPGATEYSREREILWSE